MPQAFTENIMMATRFKAFPLKNLFVCLYLYKEQHILAIYGKTNIETNKACTKLAIFEKDQYRDQSSLYLRNSTQPFLSGKSAKKHQTLSILRNTNQYSNKTIKLVP